MRERLPCQYLSSGRKGDHPRSCGKDVIIALIAAGGLGSPPLVRERLVCERCQNQKLRITPARAGKTEMTWPNHLANQDHPRSCGKDECYGMPTSSEIGSPPLVRERLNGQANLKDTKRIPRSCGKD